MINLGFGYTHFTADNLIDISKYNINYIELEPALLTKDTNNLIFNQISKYNIAFHSTELNIASTDSVNKKYLETVNYAVKRFNPIFSTDHMSFFSQNNMEVPVYVPPIYSTQNAVRLAKKAANIKSVHGYENVPDNIFGKYNEITEGEFFKIFCQESNKFIMLNINSLFMSSLFTKNSVENILQKYPLEKIKSITYVPEISMHPSIVKQIGSNFSKNVTKLLDIVLSNTNNSYLLFQAGHFSSNSLLLDQELEKFYKILNNLGVKYE